MYEITASITTRHEVPVFDDVGVSFEDAVAVHRRTTIVDDVHQIRTAILEIIREFWPTAQPATIVFPLELSPEMWDGSDTLSWDTPVEMGGTVRSLAPQLEAPSKWERLLGKDDPFGE